RRLRCHPGEEDAAVRPQHPLDDSREIRRPLPLRVDGLGLAVAQLAVQIQLGEPQIGVGKLGEILESRLGRDLPGGDRLQKMLKLRRVHDARSAPPRRYPWGSKATRSKPSASIRGSTSLQIDASR